MQMAGQAPAWLMLPLLGLVGGWLAGWLVQQFSPEAAGSGIPQVKAALANVPIALNLRVAIVKLVSVLMIVGSGFNLGRQGPTVQIGAALAAQLSRWIPTSPEYRRQLLAAGAAAGLAAGFNAPIAGVLFVVEEFLHDFSGLTLGTAILASFIGAVVSRLLGGQGLNLDPMLSTSQVTFSLLDVPFFLVLGVLAGLLGALFSKGIFASLAVNRQMLSLSLAGKVGLAGLISGVVVLLLPAEFRDHTGSQELISTGGIGWQIVLLTFVVKFLLTLIAYGSGAPGGIFAPSLVLGSALGYLVGLSAQTLAAIADTPLGLTLEIAPTPTYALAGMGAFFSAITRGPITAIVIVFEITTDFKLVLPLMIGSVIAYLIADRISTGSLYTQLLALSGIRIDEDNSSATSWAQLTAESLMQRRVETLSSQITINEAMQAFSRSHHRGFPVVNGSKLVGIVTQSDLSDPSRRQAVEGDVLLKDIMTPSPVCVSPKDPLTQVLYLLNRFKLSRLPVTDGPKLVGIITRADIIRAESDQLVGEKPDFGPQSEPSYVVYQTRSPATGKGRLLVPLSNPSTAPLLLKLAIALARDRDYELECLQVITIPRGNSPTQTLVKTTTSRRLLRQAEHLGRSKQVPVHTQIRVAHDAAQAMLETIKERHIDLALLGWKGSTTTPGWVFGSTVDTVIRQAACEVVLVKIGNIERFNRWLVPIAGGPNSQAAIELLPAFSQLGQEPEIGVCQVFEAAPMPEQMTLLSRAIEQLSQQSSYSVLAYPLWGSSIPEAIVKLSQRHAYDVILLGASRESLLKQVIRGNIPEAIARASDCTVILVRSEAAD